MNNLFTINENAELTIKVADVIAAARHDWYATNGGAEGCDPYASYYVDYLNEFVSKFNAKTN